MATCVSKCEEIAHELEEFVSSDSDWGRNGDFVDEDKKMRFHRYRERDCSEEFSRKVFVGGLPPDIDEVEILSAFSRFGDHSIDWPHKKESKSHFPPKGYCFLLFQTEDSVLLLTASCFRSQGKLFWRVSSPTYHNKAVQIRPWRIDDTNCMLRNTREIDRRLTIFVGGVPRPLKSVELAVILDDQFGGVCYAGIDTDSELHYPKGAARVTFLEHNSYIAAITSRFANIQLGDISKRVEIKPYVLDDTKCDKCGNKSGAYFCPQYPCIQYYCMSCWKCVHSDPGMETHHPFQKEPPY